MKRNRTGKLANYSHKPATHVLEVRRRDTGELVKEFYGRSADDEGMWDSAWNWYGPSHISPRSRKERKTFSDFIMTVEPLERTTNAR